MNQPIIYIDAHPNDRPRLQTWLEQPLSQENISVSYDSGDLEQAAVCLLILSKHQHPPTPWEPLADLMRTRRKTVIPVVLDGVQPIGPMKDLIRAPVNQAFIRSRRFQEWLVVKATFNFNLDTLIGTYLKGELCLMPGGGMSARVGYPVWRELTGALLGWVKRRGFMEEDFFTALEDGWIQGYFDEVADAVYNAEDLNREDLHQFVSGLVTQNVQPPEELTALLGLERLSGVITTNFDNLVETAAPRLQVQTMADGESLLEKLSHKQPFFVKLYGDPDHQPFTLSTNEFHDTLSKNAVFRDFLRGMFISRTLLFVGLSLDGLEAFTEALPSPGSWSRPHFALTAVQGDGWRMRAQALKRRFGIEVIPYVANQTHDRFHTFCKSFVAGAAEAEATPGEEPAAPPGLNRVVMNHLGPHTHLNLDLDPHFNVLLGDNGVGKTHVLKAVALAAMGKSASEHALPLIKNNQNIGQIQIHMEHSVVDLTMERLNAASVQLNLTPGGLMEFAGLFVLAFPALRTAGGADPAGYVGKRPGRTTVEDVAPLFSRTLDPRMLHLKSWLIQVDHIIAGGHPGAANYQRMRDTFFTILSDLTEGVTLKFSRVDALHHQVYLETDDGEVRLESISQGMTSLFGWIGVLTQRLFEVYADDDNPLQRHGLILIDEIDAHMHPEWQQVLVPKLKHHFPHLQFIATTHSPLIVADLPATQVHRLRRDDQGNVSALTVTEDMTRGRADQILTSRLFGLKTTRGYQTVAKIQRYQSLAAAARNSAEEQEYQALRRDLQTWIPDPDETTVERKAQALLTALMEAELPDAPPSVQQRLKERAQALFQELRDQP